MARTLEAHAIFGKGGRPHLDKIMLTPAECWALLMDQLTEGRPGETLKITEMRRLGYTCRKVRVTWEAAQSAE